LVTGLAIVALAATVARGWSCGFEDPNSATMQRVMLNVVYPDALYVQGAVDTALRAGRLKPAHFARPGDFFALQRTTGNLRHLARSLADGTPTELPAFSVVLMGPVLWTRFQPDEAGLAAEPHVTGPSAGELVVVTDVSALAALVSGEISGAYANSSGLVRYYGKPAEVNGLREALIAAFPVGRSSGTDRSHGRTATAWK
jgi:hypothetical protein